MRVNFWIKRVRRSDDILLSETLFRSLSVLSRAAAKSIDWQLSKSEKACTSYTLTCCIIALRFGWTRRTFDATKNACMAWHGHTITTKAEAGSGTTLPEPCLLLATKVLTFFTYGALER